MQGCFLKRIGSRSEAEQRRRRRGRCTRIGGDRFEADGRVAGCSRYLLLTRVNLAEDVKRRASKPRRCDGSHRPLALSPTLACPPFDFLEPSLLLQRIVAHGAD